MGFPTDDGNLVADWPFPVFINNSATLVVSPANKQGWNKSTSAGCMPPTHSLRIRRECVYSNPIAACNAASGIIYIYCCCMFYLNIWQWCADVSEVGKAKCLLECVPRAGKLHMEKGEEGVMKKKREKYPKSFQKYSWWAITSCTGTFSGLEWVLANDVWMTQQTTTTTCQIWLQEMPQDEAPTKR